MFRDCGQNDEAGSTAFSDIWRSHIQSLRSSADLMDEAMYNIATRLRRHLMHNRMSHLWPNILFRLLRCSGFI
jgi:hypothetical protein